ncbi:MAG: helix-turn-helix transcriptional regulator [Telmatospirillum sp.]|nr:helix-turn-helix transcriptional regulator [Telmatospirillum sp.]
MPSPPPTKVTLEFSRRLKKIRELSRFGSAEQFAKEINIHPHTYRLWEAGKREPSLETLCKIADKLETTLDYLVRGPRR